jgi:hypothetical protein
MKPNCNKNVTVSLLGTDALDLSTSLTRFRRASLGVRAQAKDESSTDLTRLQDELTKGKPVNDQSQELKARITGLTLLLRAVKSCLSTTSEESTRYGQECIRLREELEDASRDL